MTLSVSILIFSGCMAQTVEDEVVKQKNCADDVLVHYDPVVESDGTQSVVANVRAISLFNDTIDTLVFTEPLDGSFSLLQIPCQYLCEEFKIRLKNIVAPVRLDSADLDGDGTNELILSDIGILYPSDAKRGKVSMIKFNETTDTFSEHMIVENLGRITCAEAADLDGDDDLDLTLCEFGHTNGSVGWIENLGNESWSHHILENKSGTIEAIPIDIDGDGDLDIVSVISQLVEEIVVYWNDGLGNFESEILFKADFDYFGMSSIEIIDFEGDGDLDILFTNGDILDLDVPDDQNLWDFHGLSLLKNLGQGEFSFQRLLAFSGAYDSKLFDIDGDGIDEIIVIGFRPIIDESIDYGNNSNIAWLDWNNNSWDPIYPSNSIDISMISLEIIDLNGDGQEDLIAANHDIYKTNNASRLISIESEIITKCVEI